MIIDTEKIDRYINSLPKERKDALLKLHQTIIKNLPLGYEAGMNYGMISYHVPFKLFPDGYHRDPTDPLPFMSLANQKNSINIYHMGLYADPILLGWFMDEYKTRVKTKLDMGKSCIRFKKTENIPYDLIAELSQKMSPEEWIKMYKLARSN